MYSVRRRLTILLAVGFVLVIAALGLYVSRVVERRVTEEFDAALLAKARTLAALTEQEDGQIELDYVPEHMPEYERADAPEYFQFWLADGQMLMRSRHLGADLPTEGVPAGSPRIRDIRLPDGRPGRLVELAYVPRVSAGDEPAESPGEDEAVGEAGETLGLVLVVARGRERLDGVMAGLRWTILLAGGIAILAALLLVWRGIARGFRPIHHVASQVEALHAERLDTRVSLPRTPEELAPIVVQLNALLQRLDDAFERERRFTGNVAHELRTPLAELRSLAEVGARWPDDKEAIVGYFDDVHAVAGRMERVISDLLLLARCHAGVEHTERTPTSLREVVDAAWSKLAPTAEGVGTRLRLDLPDDLVVESDPGKLEILLSNLVGNALHHGRPHGEIACVGRRVGSGFRLEVENAADPLTDEDLQRLAEPFWRKDSARSSSDHAGLGLALVTALAGLLGLEVGFHQDDRGIFRVRLEGRMGAAGRPVGAAP